MNIKHIVTLLFVGLLAFTSCQNEKYKYDPFKGEPQNENTKKGFDINYQEESGAKTIQVFINGSAGTKAIFDTGCSGVSLSILEYVNLMKHDAVSDNDFNGQVVVSNASGDLRVNDVITVVVSLTDTEGKAHEVTVDASLEENLIAPVLIGNSVIDQLANRSYSVNLNKHTIHFE